MLINKEEKKKYLSGWQSNNMLTSDLEIDDINSIMSIVISGTNQYGISYSIDKWLREENNNKLI